MGVDYRVVTAVAVEVTEKVLDRWYEKLSAEPYSEQKQEELEVKPLPPREEWENFIVPEKCETFEACNESGCNFTHFSLGYDEAEKWYLTVRERYFSEDPMGFAGVSTFTLEELKHLWDGVGFARSLLNLKAPVKLVTGVLHW